MFSKTERLILSNQYTILQKLDPKGGWDRAAKIVQDGLAGEYGSLTDYIFDGLSEAECRYVNDVMNMYDALQRPYVDAKKPIPPEASFPGFDGNNETKFMGYARFLRDDDRWKFVKVTNANLNSHFPTASFYGPKLEAWDKLGRPYPLAGANAESVLKA
ncbi:hypothetical protein MesoLj131c_16420 [Mesorhizobium sp. 131-3-5]|uniref:YfbU family protein n=1 Tax=Mesorhizobium sp. 131-3-5 TaxID=2744520 RepID=UPI0019258372|nr:YfbU family protein [Mesorhizobium sp. 131-3-5]BCH07384.1 hypothetical protein MesoLj131c_16420 [Mesorhizobium sp. 131-3-5]